MSALAARADQRTPRLALAFLLDTSVIWALVGLTAVFGWAAPSFLTSGNLASMLVNNCALLAIVATAMTLVVASGGIDLSVGVAVDFGSFAFVTCVLAGQPVALAVAAGLAAGALVGAFNAVLICGFGIAPFLATLGTLFIGRSGQQLLTGGGGNPIYVSPSKVPAGMRFLGHGAVVDIPVALIAVALVALAVGVTLSRSRFGRAVTVLGAQAAVARYSGLPTKRVLIAVHVLAGLVCGLAGVLLAATVNVYAPFSGNAFLLNAIGAAFVGTALSRTRRPNAAGTLLGVLLLGVVANGLLLVGWNFYWQQVGAGVVILAVLAISFGGRRRSEAR
jgi:ribose transport system permease protein